MGWSKAGDGAHSAITSHSSSQASLDTASAAPTPRLSTTNDHVGGVRESGQGGSGSGAGDRVNSTPGGGAGGLISGRARGGCTDGADRSGESARPNEGRDGWRAGQLAKPRRSRAPTEIAVSGALLPHGRRRRYTNDAPRRAAALCAVSREGDVLEELDDTVAAKDALLDTAHIQVGATRSLLPPAGVPDNGGAAKNAGGEDVYTVAISALRSEGPLRNAPRVAHDGDMTVRFDGYAESPRTEYAASPWRHADHSRGAAVVLALTVPTARGGEALAGASGLTTGGRTTMSGALPGSATLGYQLYERGNPLSVGSQQRGSRGGAAGGWAGERTFHEAAVVGTAPTSSRVVRASPFDGGDPTAADDPQAVPHGLHARP